MLKEISFMVGSIIGPGIFFLPFNLSSYGVSGIFSLLFCSVLFFSLGEYFRKYNSPFDIIEEKLGRSFCYMIGVGYWFTCCLSSIVVINEISVYICSLFPLVMKFKILFEVMLLLLLTIINFFGMKNSLNLEIGLSIFKMIPLILIPFIFLYKGKGSIPVLFKTKDFFAGILPTIWCFSGIETTGFVVKSRKSFILSMIIITFIYVFNLLSVFLFFGSFHVGPRIYAEIMSKIFGSFGSILLKIIVLVESISNLNSWILSSGLFAHDLAKKNMMPKVILQINKFGAPQNAIALGSVGLLVLIFASFNVQASQIVSQFTEVSCYLFLFFYLSFAFASFLKEKDLKSLLIFLTLFFLFFLSWI